METRYTSDVAQLSRYARPFSENSFVKEKNQTGWPFRFLWFNTIIRVAREVARFVSALRARGAFPFSRQ
jgi:hypothetical protein